MKYESELEHIEQFSEEEREEIASFYEKMSKTSDTPETDAKASTHIGFYSCATVPADFARRLERERDEAKEIIRKASVKFFEDGPDGQIAVKMFEILGSLEKEAR